MRHRYLHAVTLGLILGAGLSIWVGLLVLYHSLY